MGKMANARKFKKMQQWGTKCKNNKCNMERFNNSLFESYCNIRYDNTNHKVIRKIRLKTMNMKMTE